MHINNQWRRWTQGAVAAICGGGVSPVSATAIAPEAFSPRTHLTNFLMLWGSSAIISFFLYLQKAPPPLLSDDVTVNIKDSNIEITHPPQEGKQ